MTVRTFGTAIASFLEHLDISPGALVVSAYSGGKDSAALLTALAELAPAKGFRLRALYVDHGLRPENELASERTIVAANCRRMNIPLTVATVRRGAIERMAARRGCGIEAAARGYRYRAYAATAERFGAAYVATGHTADDQAETLLMRFLKGSGTEGSAGMPAARPLGKSAAILIRPMLGVSRRDIEAYLAECGTALAISEDSTNVGTDYSRNKIRHMVIPALDAAFPDWKKAASSGAEKAFADASALRAEAESNVIRTREGCADIGLRAFLAAPEAIRVRMLLVAAGMVSGDTAITWKAARAAVSAIADGCSRRSFPGLSCTLGKDALRVARILDFPLSQGYFFSVDGEGIRRAGGLALRAFWTETAPSDRERSETVGASKDASRNRGGNGLRKGSFEFPLIVRTRRAGDSIATEAGKIRIDELLSSWKIPAAMRDAVPIVEDRKGIVAVLPAALVGSRYRNVKFRFCASDPVADLFRIRIRIKGASIPNGK